MQEEEIARSQGYNITEASLDDVDDHTGGGSASEAVANVFGTRNDYDDDDETSEFANGISIAGHDARQIHLRKSEQPLVWRLDPREDFKANKNKNKKWIDRAEKERQEYERMLERSPRNGIHGLAPEPEPLEITPEVEAVQAAIAGAEGAIVAAVEVEGSQPAQSTEAHAVHEVTNIDEEEEDHGIEKIQNRIVVVEEDDSEDEEEESENVNAEDDDDEGVLSDDSWEEIPDQGVVNLAISDDQEVLTSSSSSPFLLTPANGGSSPNPGASSSPSIPIPRALMREI